MQLLRRRVRVYHSISFIDNRQLNLKLGLEPYGDTGFVMERSGISDDQYPVKPPEISWAIMRVFISSSCAKSSPFLV